MLLFFLSGIYIFIFSESGLLERMQLENNNKHIEIRLKKLRDKRYFLTKKLYSIQKGLISPKALSDIGYIKQGNKVVVLKPFKKKSQDTVIDQKKTNLSFKISHFRIIWITLSITIIILHFTRISKNKNSNA